MLFIIKRDMNKTLIMVILLLFFSGIDKLPAQNKLFTAADYLNRELYPKTLTGLSWRGDMNSFTWVENEKLLQKAASDPSRVDTILTLGKLNLKLKNLKQEERKFSIPA